MLKNGHLAVLESRCVKFNVEGDANREFIHNNLVSIEMRLEGADC